jgi:hypothetical protein
MRHGQIAACDRVVFELACQPVMGAVERLRLLAVPSALFTSPP